MFAVINKGWDSGHKLSQMEQRDITFLCELLVGLAIMLGLFVIENMVFFFMVILLRRYDYRLVT